MRSDDARDPAQSVSAAARSQGQGLALAAGLAGLGSVVLAALGSHALPLDTDRAVELWRLALQFLFFHVAVTLATVALASQWRHRRLLVAGWWQLLACLLFSGSLMLRALQFNFLPSSFTPFAGGLLMLGWLFWTATLMFKADR